MDFYRTTVNEISWKPEMDKIPELDFVFSETDISTLHEMKPYKDKHGNKYECNYFPGFIMTIQAARDPY